jgi:hypothetical protein
MKTHLTSLFLAVAALIQPISVQNVSAAAEELSAAARSMNTT